MTKSIHVGEMAFERGNVDRATVLYRVVHWSGSVGKRRLRMTRYFTSAADCTAAVDRIAPENLILVQEFHAPTPETP